MSNVIELDPFFSNAKGVICEMDVSEIVRRANSIAKGADLLWLMKDPSASVARYDLRKSAQCLRDAAERLDQLAAKSKQDETPPFWTAAE